MGWKSTKDITREDCITQIYENLHTATDRQLADILETLIGDDEGANYRIVSENQQDKEI